MCAGAALYICLYIEYILIEACLLCFSCPARVVLKRQQDASVQNAVTADAVSVHRGT